MPTKKKLDLSRVDLLSASSKEPEDGPPFTMGQTARELGIQMAQTRNLVTVGVLDGEKIGGRWLISRASVERRKQTVRRDLQTNHTVLGDSTDESAA